MKLIRQIICPKDIQIYTGKSLSTSYRVLERVRKLLDKSKDDWVTVREFCRVQKIDEAAMMEVVRNNSL